MTISELYYARKYLVEKINQSEPSLRLQYEEALQAVENLIDMMIQYKLKN